MLVFLYVCLVYLFDGISTPYGLSNTEMGFMSKCLILHFFLFLKSFVCTQLYEVKYSYQIHRICTQLYGFKYSHLIQIIYTQLYGFE